MTTQPFSLRLHADTRPRLQAAARRHDRPAAQDPARANTRWLAAEATLRSAIVAAVAEAEAGAFVSSEAVAAWMETWGSGSEAPPPAADILPRG
jgi:predicted transcriptional regulator